MSSLIEAVRQRRAFCPEDRLITATCLVWFDELIPPKGKWHTALSERR